MHNIIVLVLPAHTSHLLQPLDLAVFGVFKAALSKGDSSLGQLTLSERRSSLMRKAIRSLHAALSIEVVLRSWKLSGLWLFEPSIPLQHPCVLLKQEQEPLTIDAAIKGRIERYTINGKVITNFAEIEAIRGVEHRRKKWPWLKYQQVRSLSMNRLWKTCLQTCHPLLNDVVDLQKSKRRPPFWLAPPFHW